MLPGSFSRTNTPQIAAAEIAAADAFQEINIDVGGGGTLNFIHFIKWWQNKMKAVHSANRITDEELQVCQRIWHEYDVSCTIFRTSQNPSQYHNIILQ